jgi:hypothetical protein
MNRRMLRVTFCFSSFVLIVAASVFPQQVRYGTGSWDAATLGNHRAVLRVAVTTDAVWSHIPWRRRDTEPEKKAIIVTNESGLRIPNVLRIDVNRYYGDLVFQVPSQGTYYVYFLPFVSKGRNYPVVTYPPPEETADPVWEKHVRSALLRSDRRLPQAELVEIQSIDEFSSFYPMEISATPEEVDTLHKLNSSQEYLLFPEDRRFPIRMTGDLPQKWAVQGPVNEFSGEAGRGEYYAFQIGLYAASADIKDVGVRFSEFRGDERSIPASAVRCINAGGINWDSTRFSKAIAVEKGKVQALWVGVQIPEDLPPGKYRGKVTIHPSDLSPQSVAVALAVKADAIPDFGDDEPWRHSRLRWLDSMLAVDDDIVRPFTPVRVNGNRIGILGRRLTLAPSGLPEQVESQYTPEVTQIQEAATPLLAAPMRLVVEDSDGRSLTWSPGAIAFTEQEYGIAAWKADSTAGPLKMELAGAIEFDGFVQFRITLEALRPFEVRDIRLEMPLLKDAVRYMMGLGLKGGRRPPSYDWTWDVKKNQDSAWLGDSGAGLQFSLRAENYSRPLNTNFYQSKPLNMPPSWFNDGKGGITIREIDGSTVLISCFAGGRTLRPGEDLHFDFNLLLTPFKPLDTRSHWGTRYFHNFKPVDEAIRAGANTINVHHANDVNPYINYPFLHQKEMKAYIDEAHRKGLRVKIYYTIRELSNRAPELFALRSLRSEIFSAGPGGGFSWLQEHVGTDYIAAWFVPELQDAAIINSGMSRWHNYYVEGLRWLVDKMQIDGLYIDDLAFDRTTMKRVRKVLDRGRPAAMIDLHSANQYNPRDGFANSANLYLEHFPYIDRLWFGEYFDPNSPPDFWFTEMSGIPYGLMGEMLQDGGNRWRGMLYGMTSRMPYDGNDPSHIWKVWDDFRIQESDMIGYWSPRCPVKTDHKDVLATAYVKKGAALISMASWAPEDVAVRLTVDWRALGIESAKAALTAPEVSGFQPAARFAPSDPIPVPKGKGWLLIVKGGPLPQKR